MRICGFGLLPAVRRLMAIGRFMLLAVYSLALLSEATEWQLPLHESVLSSRPNVGGHIK